MIRPHPDHIASLRRRFARAGLDWSALPAMGWRDLARGVLGGRTIGRNGDHATPSLLMDLIALMEAGADPREVDQVRSAMDASGWLSELGIRRRAWEVSDADYQLLAERRPWAQQESARLPRGDP